MKTIRSVPTRDAGVRCAVCQTHSRPLYVPWHQHAVGCDVRAAELQRRKLELRPPPRAVSSIAGGMATR
jgi:hypothetical protein